MGRGAAHHCGGFENAAAAADSCSKRCAAAAAAAMCAADGAPSGGSGGGTARRLRCRSPSSSPPPAAPPGAGTGPPAPPAAAARRRSSSRHFCRWLFKCCTVSGSVMPAGTRARICSSVALGDAIARPPAASTAALNSACSSGVQRSRALNGRAAAAAAAAARTRPSLADGTGAAGGSAPPPAPPRAPSPSPDGGSASPSAAVPDTAPARGRGTLRLVARRGLLGAACNVPSSELRRAGGSSGLPATGASRMRARMTGSWRWITSSAWTQRRGAASGGQAWFCVVARGTVLCKHHAGRTSAVTRSCSSGLSDGGSVCTATSRRDDSGGVQASWRGGGAAMRSSQPQPGAALQRAATAAAACMVTAIGSATVLCCLWDASRASRQYADCAPCSQRITLSV